MTEKGILKKISDVQWEIGRDFRSDMRVPARVFASEKMIADISRDRSLGQLVNVATLPGIQIAAIAMPDIHEGYGFPIGAVAATEWPDGVISPGGIGYDINCGVRLLRSDLMLADVEPHLARLADEIARAVPSGVGRTGRLSLDVEDLDAVLRDGIDWALREGYANKDDRENIESNGHLTNADPISVSLHAKKRGSEQLGTMGSGNHFVEVDYVEKVFDQDIADAFGVQEGRVLVQIHCGSRGLGHQVATDYIKVMIECMQGYGITIPDRELACAPLSSPEGQAYFNAMAAAANFAWANRQIIAWEVRNEWSRIFGESENLATLYDVAHNIAKIEEHQVDGVKKKLILHRKGATRAFGPGHPELPLHYRETGQPVAIPGSMGTASYVLAGAREAMAQSFGSCCHGAGRRLSRHAAKKEIGGKTLLEQLKASGIAVRAGSLADLAEEAPLAYKDVNGVVDVVHKAGLARKVACLKPLSVVKG
jgi:tRNA-splicing ligase RtcB